MIKLVPLLELEINNPNPTAEEIFDYFQDNIWNDNINFGVDKIGWEKYEHLCQLYTNKKFFSDKHDFKVLSQPDRNKFFHELKQLVRKYS